MTGQLRSLDRAFFDLSARVKLGVSGVDRLRFGVEDLALAPGGYELRLGVDLAFVGPIETRHVDLGMLEATDRQIWGEAISRSAVLVTKDRDFRSGGWLGMLVQQSCGSASATSAIES